MRDMKEYLEGVQRLVGCNFAEIVSTLVVLCNVKPPSCAELDRWLDGDGEITTARETYHLIEGCCEALDTVVNAPIECYQPCINLIDEINKKLYNWYKFNSNNMHNKSEWDIYVSGGGGVVSALTNAKTTDEVFHGMIGMLKHPVYAKFHYITVILFVEAVLLYRFRAFWIISEIDATILKAAIANAKQDKIDELCSCFQHTYPLVPGADIIYRE